MPILTIKYYYQLKALNSPINVTGRMSTLAENTSKQEERTFSITIKIQPILQLDQHNIYQHNHFSFRPNFLAPHNQP